MSSIFCFQCEFIDFLFEKILSAYLLILEKIIESKKLRTSDFHLTSLNFKHIFLFYFSQIDFIERTKRIKN